MGKYIRLFNKHASYNGYINSMNKILPNVTFCEDESNTHYNKLVSSIKISFNLSSPGLERISIYGNFSIIQGSTNADGLSNVKLLKIDNQIIDIENDLIKNIAFTFWGITINAYYYNFTSSGAHTIEYILKSPVITEGTCSGLGDNTFIQGSPGFMGHNSTVVYFPSNMTNLSAIISGVKKIDKFGFLLSNLEDVYISNELCEISGGAFTSNLLNSIYIPANVKTINIGGFMGSLNIESIIVDSNNTVYDSRDNCNAIIETATNILIAGCKNTIIPNSVTSIGQGAFYQIYDLTNIIIPNSVEYIGDDAFYGCIFLESITIPNSIKEIGESTFNGCIFEEECFINNSNLDAQANNYWGGNIIPPGYVDIYDRLGIMNNQLMFCGKYNENIIIPNTVTSIGDNVFHGYFWIKNISIPNTVTSIGQNAFAGCSNLTGITIPASVTSINNYTFSCGKNFINIVVDSNNAVYDSRDNCNAIIETATNTLIAGCNNTVIPNSVTSISEGAFTGCSSLTSIIIPNSVTAINNYTFGNCSRLKNVTIGNSVTLIDDQAFVYCTNLNSITIPSSVTTMNNSVFLGCASLTNITCLGTTAPTINSYTFSSINTNGTLTVPSGSTGYDTWMQYLSEYNWTLVEQ